MPVAEPEQLHMEQRTICVGCGKSICTGAPSVPTFNFQWTCNNPNCIDTAAIMDMDSQEAVASLFSDVDVVVS